MNLCTIILEGALQDFSRPHSFSNGFPRLKAKEISAAKMAAIGAHISKLLCLEHLKYNKMNAYPQHNFRRITLPHFSRPVMWNGCPIELKALWGRLHAILPIISNVLMTLLRFNNSVQWTACIKRCSSWNASMFRCFTHLSCCGGIYLSILLHFFPLHFLETTVPKASMVNFLQRRSIWCIRWPAFHFSFQAEKVREL